MVDRITRKVEAKLQHHDSVGERNSRQLVEKTAVRTDSAASVARATRPALQVATTEATPRELIEAALAESKELVKLEVALAKVELKKQLHEATRAAIGFGVAAVLAIVALALFAVAVVLALGANPVNAVLTAVVVLVIAAGAAWFGYAQLPKAPLPETRRHLEDDLKQLKEHLA